MFTYEIRGLKEMGDELSRLPGKIARRMLAASVRKGAVLIRTEARASAPIGTKTYKDYRGKTHRPGLLRKYGIVHKKLRPKNWQTTALYGIGFSKRGFYGRWVEKGKNKKHRQEPHPIIVPAMERRAIEAIEEIKNELGIQLDLLIKEIPGVTKA